MQHKPQPRFKVVLAGTPIHEDLIFQTVQVQSSLNSVSTELRLVSVSIAGIVVTLFHEDLRSQKVPVHIHIKILCHKHAIFVPVKCHLCRSNVIIVLYISLMTV
jgi:hypothetical protein